jgi:hypothetical protein
VDEPEKLTECPYHDEELSRDSYLSPAFSSHGDILSGRQRLATNRHCAHYAGPSHFVGGATPKVILKSD